MRTITQSIGLLWHALFLDRQAYATLRDEESPVSRGLIILLILGLAIALAGIIGTTLEWATSPSLNDLKDAIWELNQQAPWWENIESEPQALAMFEQIWNQIWDFMGLVIPSPVSSLSGLITKPLNLIVSWLIFGLLAHLFARLLGGSGKLDQTLGALALASAPQLLLLLTTLPYIVIAGIGTWTLICRYMAVRVTHNLSWTRTLWAVFLPVIVLGFLVFLVAMITGVVAGTLIAGGL
jgi:hypothetical protein